MNGLRNLLLLPFGFLCAPSFVVGWPAVATYAQTDPVELAAEIRSLQEAAPAFSTLQARYRVESISTVAGHPNSYFQQGRIYITTDSVFIFEDVLSDLSEAQIVYTPSSQSLLRYFPFSAYGHRIVPESLDKQRTDFARWWRALMVYLFPEHELRRLQSVRAEDGESSEAEGHSFRVLVVDADQEADIQQRQQAPNLEYWGPRPDLKYYISSANDSVDRLESVQYEVESFSPARARIAYYTSAQLGAFEMHGEVRLPTEIVFEARLPQHRAPYRRSTVTLFDIRVNEPLPAEALEPIWPDDMIFLDVENQLPSAYLPTSNDPASMIMLADYYLWIGQREEGMRWLKQFRQVIGDRQRSPVEASNLARLLAFATVGRAADGRKLLLDVIEPLEKRVLSQHEVSDELLLTRYYTEYGHFIALSTPSRSDVSAAEYLESRLDLLESPLAIARVAGRIAEHYTDSDRYAKAHSFLAQARSRVGGDDAARLWINASIKRVSVAQQRDEYWQRIHQKKARIRNLQARLRQSEHVDDGGEVIDREALEKELERLQTEP